MSTKKYLKIVVKFFINSWYSPLLLILVAGFCGSLLFPIKGKIFLQLSSFIPFIAVVLALAVGVYSLLRRKYFLGLVQVITSLTLGIVGYYIFAVMAMLYPYDYYATHIKIPVSASYEIPEIEDSKPVDTNGPYDFKLYSGSQGGRYRYTFYTQRIEKGSVYVKAIELSRADHLSEPRLEWATTLEVENNSDEWKFFSQDREFTIYEGDWGDYYLADFALWFRPDGGGPERKLDGKIYRIEGWQR